MRKFMLLLAALATILGTALIAPTAQAASGWTGYHRCFFNALAWEDVRVHLVDGGTVGIRINQLQYKGSEKVDRITYVREYRGGSVVGSALVDHPAPNVGNDVTGTFAMPYVLAGNGRSWRVQLHRSNGTLLPSCNTGLIGY